MDKRFPDLTEYILLTVFITLAAIAYSVDPALVNYWLGR
jgi:hypothetical protein